MPFLDWLLKGPGKSLADPPQNEAEPKRESASDRRTRRIYGGFICAIGFAVEVVVLVLLRPSLLEHGNGAGFWFMTLAALAIATALLFSAVNLSNRWAWTFGSNAKPDKKTRVRVRTLLGGLGAASLLGALTGFAAAAKPERPAQYDLYTLAIPAAPAARLEDTSAADKKLTSTSAPAGAPATQLPAAAADTAATLYWWAERKPPPLPSGTLLMFLGGLLALGFGIFYPRISAGGATQALGSIERMLAPVLSTALIAIGATQQAEVTEAKANADMMRQALPTVAEAEVKAKNGDSKLLIQTVPYESLNAKTADELRQKLDEHRLEILRLLERQLQAEVNAENRHALSDERLQTARERLTQRIDFVADALGKRSGNPPVDVKLTTSGVESHLEKLATTNAASEGRLQRAADDLRSERGRICVDVQAKLRDASPQKIADLRKEAEAQRAKSGFAQAGQDLVSLVKPGAARRPAEWLDAQADRRQAELDALRMREATYCDRPVMPAPERVAAGK